MKAVVCTHPKQRNLGPLIVLLLLSLACGQSVSPVPSSPTASAVTETAATPTPADRLASIPAGAVKVAPAEDRWQPLIAPGWSRPQPLGAPINTAGAEDSPFILPDGQTLYFFFTPDLHIPAEKQLFDGVTGIWAARRSGGGWADPQRVTLAAPGEVHLDGCPFVLGDQMYFCSARAGNFRDVDLFTAVFENGRWSDWQNAGQTLNQEYQAGEMHLTADGSELYFGSSRPGGAGGYDLWVSPRASTGWAAPQNLGAAVNTPGDENRPFVSPNGQELWYDAGSRQGAPGPAVFRCLRQPDGSWNACTEIVSSFAGEPTLTGDGRTLYFVHHYFTADMRQMIEADIYVSTRQ
ncbi:MAG: hypothetical protein AB1894_09150 [Chloroflexota bacterium]